MRPALSPRGCLFALALLSASISLVAACSSREPAAASCERQTDCPAGQSCSNAGVCVTGDITCSASSPCPDNLACCGGICSRSQCCAIDSDCPGGYCAAGGECVEGDRPACSEDEPCTTGRCLPSLGHCVECLYDDDCPNPDLTCTSDHACAVPTAGCTSVSCATTGKLCNPAEGTCYGCTTSPECGVLFCEAGTCRPCTAADTCGTGLLCDEGKCVHSSTTPCVANADCGDYVCDTTSKRCRPCTGGGECGGVRTCTNGRCGANPAQCTSDSGCNPPQTICVADRCEPGCETAGCAEGQRCNGSTGRCVMIESGDATLGTTCHAHSDCDSGLCFAVNEGTTATALCSQTCSRHDDCPAGFVCFELGDGNLCVPTSRVASGTYATDPGGVCDVSPIDRDCATGYCDPDNHVCLEMCGNNADCESELGVTYGCYSWRMQSTATTSVCDVDHLSQDPAGTECGSGLGGMYIPDHSLCQSGFCAQTPNAYEPPRCAQLCCTPSDCMMSSSICKPIHMYDDGIYEPGDAYGFQKICLWREYEGTKNIGDICSADSECRSEICTGVGSVRRCTHTCCTNRDCANYAWGSTCRPPFPADGSPGDANATAIANSLGRMTENRQIAWAIAPVCMPTK